MEHAIFQLQNIWEHFVREFVLTSALGTFYSSTGPIVSKLPNKMTSKEHAAHVLMSTYKKRTTEPNWYLPTDAIDAASRLKLSNLSNIAGGLGKTPWLLEDLRYTRNFFAHRSKESAKKVRDMSWFSPKNGAIDVNSTVFFYSYGGAYMIELWATEMKNIAVALAN